MVVKNPISQRSCETYLSYSHCKGILNGLERLTAQIIFHIEFENVGNVIIKAWKLKLYHVAEDFDVSD